MNSRPRSKLTPRLVEIPDQCVILSAPECPGEFALAHRWGPPRRVFVPRFQIGAYAVTRAEYTTFLDETGHAEPADWNDPALSNPQLPVCGISAFDADAYVEWLVAYTGRPFRLPRADEWEAAARGGLDRKRFPWGDEEPEGRCHFGLDQNAAPLPVGSFDVNNFGLHDMVGNVWQWLADLYVDIASNEPVNTPTKLPAELNRVLVGGSFMTRHVGYLHVAYRHEDPPDLRHRCLGVRIAL